MIGMLKRFRLLAWVLVLAFAPPFPAMGQPAGTTTMGQPAGATATGQPPGTTTAFTPEELEQVVAPIALYPDPLLAQVLMASTYPLEIVQAARFMKDHKDLKGAQLDEALKDQTWDDSVKSLTAFPDVLTLMDGKLDWTQKLGDAFLAQEKGVMDAIQRLRARAQAQGNLKSTPEQNVIVEPVAVAAPGAPVAVPPAAGQLPQPGQPPRPEQPPQVQQLPAPPPTTVEVQQPTTVIKIEPTNPQVVYVPSYNPTVAYGAWPYPAYPPAYPYPPGYAFGAAALSFGIGMAVGGALWGNCNWGGGNVDVDVNRSSNYSRNVNRSGAANERVSHYQQGQRGNQSQWKHNPENRRGVQYRDQGTQQKFNRGSNAQGVQSREQFRGRAEQGRQQMGQGGAQGGRGQSFGGGQGPGGGSFGGAQGAGGGRGGASAFQGMGSSGAATRDYSNRGQASRQSMGGGGFSSGSRPSGGGGASRGGGGGGARGGGGGGGGGGRGGGRR